MSPSVTRKYGGTMETNLKPPDKWEDGFPFGQVAILGFHVKTIWGAYIVCAPRFQTNMNHEIESLKDYYLLGPNSLAC